MNNDIVYKALSGKLRKDWLHFLMKDTLLHSKEAKLYSKTLNFVDSSMNIFNGIHDEQKMVTEEIKQKIIDFNIKSMETYKTNERQILKPAINNNKFLRQLKIIGIPENKKKFSNERLLKDKKSIHNLAEEMGVQLAIEGRFRLGEYDSKKQRPVLVTCPSICDSRLYLSTANESKLHGRTKTLVIPEFSAPDKEKEKKLLMKRFELIQNYCIKMKFKRHNLKQFYNNQEVALD